MAVFDQSFVPLADTDDFALFGVPRRFAQDRQALDDRWRALQAQVHPDRFVLQGTAALNAALQSSVQVNKAYQRLKNPLQRAVYLCDLYGAAVDAENNTAMPAAFLMQQMQWREALEDAQAVADVQDLADEVAAYNRAGFSQLAAALDIEHDFPAAAQQVRALMFAERFATDVDRRLRHFEEQGS